MEKLKPLRVVRSLSESPFRHRIGSYEFVFSSAYNKQRFKNYIAAERKHFSDRVKKLYGMHVLYNSVTPFVLYRNVERRGYLVRYFRGDFVTELHDPKSVEFVADVHFLPDDAP